MAEKILIVILLGIIAILGNNFMVNKLDEVYRQGRLIGYDVGKSQCQQKPSSKYYSSSLWLGL